MRNILDYYNLRRDLLDISTPKTTVKPNCTVLDYNNKLHELCIELNNTYSHPIGYTVTFNPNKKLKLFGKTKTYGDLNIYELNEYFKITLNRRLKKSKGIFIIMGEISNGGKWHYHGVCYDVYPMEFKTILGKYLAYKFGYAKPEYDIRYPDNWVNYMFKNKKLSTCKCYVLDNDKKLNLY